MTNVFIAILITLYIFFLFLFWWIMWWFLWVLITRTYHHEKISWMLFWRSKCDCWKTIHLYEMIPVISYYALWWRCQKCWMKLSKFYPLVEFAVASDFLIIFLSTTFKCHMNFFKTWVIDLSLINPYWFIWWILIFIFCYIFHFYSFTFYIKKWIFKV